MPDRLRAGLAAAGAAVLGAAPHVLHHAGPLAGAALLGGLGGQLLFGAVGLAAAYPLLRRVRRRTGSWRLPAGLLALMAALFTASSLLIAPALEGDGGEDRPQPALPGAPSDHESHHP